MIIITVGWKASTSIFGYKKRKKNTHTQRRINGSIHAPSALSILALLTLVSGCQQTVALTFLANELFQFNDPFCRKNKTIAEIIAEGREERCKKGSTHTHLIPYAPCTFTCEDTCIHLIMLINFVCVSEVHVLHLALDL